jgi:hypothetical protein
VCHTMTMENKTTMTNLSPAAQAVLDALNETSCDWASMEQASPQTIAAALRAAADRAQASVYSSVPSSDRREGWKEGVRNTAQALRAIADELEDFGNR